MKKALAIVGVLLLSGTAMVACGGGSDGDGGGTPNPTTGTIYGSCAQSAEGKCTDFSGENLSTALVASLQASQCTGTGEVWSPSACPTANRIGTCSYDLTEMLSEGDAGGTPLKVHLRYYANAGLDALAAQLACAALTTFGSTWTPN